MNVSLRIAAFFICAIFLQAGTGAANSTVTTAAETTTSTTTPATVETSSKTTTSSTTPTTAETTSETTESITKTTSNLTATKLPTNDSSTTSSSLSSGGASTTSSSSEVTSEISGTNTGSTSSGAPTDSSTLSLLTNAAMESTGTNRGSTPSSTSMDPSTQSASTNAAVDTTVDPCSNVKCVNGTCAGGKCECISGFTGVDCSTDIDECESNPCSDPPRYCKDNPGGYECLCLPAFYEETETKECKKAKQQFKAELKFAEITVGNQKINSSQIFINPNSIEAKEKKDKVMKAVEIELQQIFVGNDSISGVKVTNLRKGSLIVDFILYFVNRTSNDTELKKNLQEIIEAKLSECTDDNTTCNFGNITGFVLNSLNTTVVDFCNEYLPCDLQTTNCNTSLNTGTYSCNCKDGFQRYPPERGITDACQDIDECITGQHACGKLKCINTPGSYQCECKYGEYRDPDTDKCIDVCSGVTCNDKGTCERDKSTFFCRCQHGHTGRECEATDSQAQTQAITLYAVAGGVWPSSS
ncbi:neurogenic locus notch homolog protein 1-like [Lingula anatina]|uniref:Neurogenic locus notch homolog protein 1-like n=1 Tax=Lingula anatina TaxID=7574 RepID=A0A2R2MS41_LINAN|nr:neurogenic locus notch homolog protein 1-like [Lingula anatina]|eukprot:XP_023933080.1 neurogenic locus notch homolog protein 1-like [Lingula anatina]